MILLLELLGVFVAAGLGVMFALMALVPLLSLVIRGGRATVRWWHAALGGALLAVALWQAITFGLIA